MSLADEIARTLPVPARIVRLPDGPAVRPDLNDPRPDPTVTAIRMAGGAPLTGVGTRATRQRGAWRHARPHALADRGFKAAPDVTAPPAPPRTDGPVTTWHTDAASAEHLAALHAHRVLLADMADAADVPMTFAWTRPDGRRVEWTATPGPTGVECHRVTARPVGLDTARAQYRGARDVVDTLASVIGWHATSLLAQSPAAPPALAARGWTPCGNYTGTAAVLADLRLDALEAHAAERAAASAVHGMAWSRRSVEVAHQRAARVAAMDADTLAAHKARNAAANRRARAKRRALDFTAGIARARKAARPAA